MAIKKADLIELLVDLIQDKEEPKKTEEPNPEPKKVEEPKKAEEPKPEPKSDPEPEPKKEENDETAKLREQIAKQTRESAENSVRSALKEGKLDDDHFTAINKYIEYGKLINENGDVDKDAVKELTDSLTSIALRTPPKSKNSLEDLSSKSTGLSKYLS